MAQSGFGIFQTLIWSLLYTAMVEAATDTIELEESFMVDKLQKEFPDSEYIYTRCEIFIPKDTYFASHLIGPKAEITLSFFHLDGLK